MVHSRVETSSLDLYTALFNRVFTDILGHELKTSFNYPFTLGQCDDDNF